MDNRLQWAGPTLSCEFEPHRLNSPTKCELCNKIILGVIGKQSLQCENCSFICHKKCGPKKPNTCPFNYVGDYNEHRFEVHTWSSPTFCNVCRKLMTGLKNQGLKCVVCGFSCHAKDCADAAFHTCPTGYVDNGTDYESYGHQWLEGNIRGHCDVCEGNVSGQTHLQGFQCFWCRKKVCNYKCQRAMPHECKNLDTQQFVPPNFIRKSEEYGVIMDRELIEEAGIVPLIVHVYPRTVISRNFMHEFYKYLNPLQVVDMGDGEGSIPSIQMMVNSGIENYRILVVGGDRAVSMVFKCLDKIGITPDRYPAVGVIPTGVTNDLARTFGWGGSTQDMKKTEGFIGKMHLGNVAWLDRWNLDFLTRDHEGEFTHKTEKKTYSTNCISIGLDAEIALQYKLRSDQIPDGEYEFAQALKFTVFESETAFTGYPSIQKKIILEVDGEVVPLPDIKGLALVNIPNTYGTNFWADEGDLEGTFQPMRIDDQIIEIVGIESSYHLGKIQTGIGQTIQIAQGSDIRITLRQDLAITVDGSPKSVKPCLIHITPLNTVPVVINPLDCHKYLNE
eukprot:TRINITY_DN4897_c0_g1_i1.p1 TRINITY_DN4897_c0_g1~~TRINITY_DN4897_c0_g1_i1.p1  ORF type:complete len:561 (-),score=97.44 TRINITY_DN4897_c0_g1_i1:39-1721(-)